MDRTIGDVLIDHAKVAQSLRDFEEQCRQTRLKMNQKIIEGGGNGNHKKIQG